MGNNQPNYSLDRSWWTLLYQGPSFKQGYKICQCIQEYIVGENGYEVEYIYNVPSKKKLANISSNETYKGIKS